MTAPKAPAGLGASGRRRWRAVTGSYVLAEHELVILVEAVRTADLLDALEVEIRSEGAIVESPQGRKANPAAVEARQQRLTLARLLVALRIPLDDAQTKGRTPARRLRGVYSTGRSA